MFDSTSLVSNIWYGSTLSAEMYPAPCGRSNLQAFLRGVRLGLAARRGRVVLTSEGTARPVGLAGVMFVSFLFSRRNVAVLEFLPGKKSGLSGRCIRFVYRRLIRRTCLLVQVMTAWEKEVYAFEYCIPDQIIFHIPFYHIDDRNIRDLKLVPESDLVFSSGRNSCAWDSVAGLSALLDVPVVGVCSKNDEPAARQEMLKVSERTGRNTLDLRVELPRTAHDELLESSGVYFLALRDQGCSSGHVRLMSCATAGIPVVAIHTRGIDGYERLVSALVEPEDLEGASQAVQRLLFDKRYREERLLDARRFALMHSRSAYLSEIERVLSVQVLGFRFGRQTIDISCRRRK